MLNAHHAAHAITETAVGAVAAAAHGTAAVLGGTVTAPAAAAPRLAFAAVGYGAYKFFE